MIFIGKVFVRFRMYDKIISDRGPQFASKFTREVARLLEYKVALSTAYHPQMDGQTERYNQMLETFLRIYCAGNPEKWKQYLFLVEFAHNS
jgi:transposase InsO family protein